jgi:hypothetical protein
MGVNNRFFHHTSSIVNTGGCHLTKQFQNKFQIKKINWLGYHTTQRSLQFFLISKFLKGMRYTQIHKTIGFYWNPKFLFQDFWFLFYYQIRKEQQNISYVLLLLLIIIIIIIIVFYFIFKNLFRGWLWQLAIF